VARRGAGSRKPHMKKRPICSSSFVRAGNTALSQRTEMMRHHAEVLGDVLLRRVDRLGQLYFLAGVGSPMRPMRFSTHREWANP
jgi:hypothetical protein